jgi:predicted nuclease with TOPRIM domain
MSRVLKFAAVAVTLSVSVAALASSGAGASLLQQLDATPDQQETLKELREDVRDVREELKETRQALRDQAREAVGADDLDTDRLHALVDEGTQAMSVTLHATVDALGQAWDVLEPDQREQAIELFQERAEKKARRQKQNQHPFRDDGLPRTR